MQDIGRLKCIEMGENVHQFGAEDGDSGNRKGEPTVSESRGDGHQNPPADEMGRGQQADKAASG